MKLRPSACALVALTFVVTGAAAFAGGDDKAAADRPAKPWPAELAKVDAQLTSIEAGVERMRAAKTDAARDAIAAGVEAEQKRYAVALYGQYSAALRTTSRFASTKGKVGSLEPLRVFEDLAQAHEIRLKAIETNARALRGGAVGFVPTPIDRSQPDVMSRVAGFFIPSANAAIALSVYNVCNRKPFNAVACAAATAQGVSQGNAAYATYNSCWAKQEGVRPKWWRATLRAACATALGVRLA